MYYGRVERSKFMPAVWKTILPEWEIKAVQAIIHEDKTDEGIILAYLFIANTTSMMYLNSCC